MFIRKSKLIGETINGYEIIDSHRKPTAGTYLICKCLYCGEIQEKYLSHVKNGKARCSCRNKHKTRRGETKTRLHHIYRGMLARTTNENVLAYKDYGGSGIKVCDEWANDFNKFKDWALSHGYEEDLTIDRIDPRKDYEPTNCRWVTMDVQAKNKRNVKIIELNGERHTIPEWSEITGVKAATIRARLKQGWPEEKAVTKEPRKCISQT